MHALCYLQSTLDNWGNCVDWDNSCVLCPQCQKKNSLQDCYQEANPDLLQKHQNRAWSVKKLQDKDMRRSSWISPLFHAVSLTRLLLTRCLDRLYRTTILEGDLWPHLTIWPRKNGRFGNVVLGETNTLQQTSSEVEVAEPWRPWSTSNSNFSKLGRIRTLSKKTQDVDIWAMLPDDITRVRFLHFALWFGARLHHGNCSKCSIQILVSGHKCGSFGAPAWSRLGWYFGVGSANPWTHVTQRRFRGHTNFRSG